MAPGRGSASTGATLGLADGGGAVGGSGTSCATLDAGALLNTERAADGPMGFALVISSAEA